MEHELDPTGTRCADDCPMCNHLKDCSEEDKKRLQLQVDDLSPYKIAYLKSIYKDRRDAEGEKGAPLTLALVDSLKKKKKG
jgi:hypothetical protein